jgi:hypothetical protein
MDEQNVDDQLLQQQFPIPTTTASTTSTSNNDDPMMDELPHYNTTKKHLSNNASISSSANVIPDNQQYDGVWIEDQNTGLFHAKIQCGTNTFWNLGAFRTEMEAARNYDLAARYLKFHDSDLNFPHLNYSELPHQEIPAWVDDWIKKNSATSTLSASPTGTTAALPVIATVVTNSKKFHGVVYDPCATRPWNARLSFMFHDICIGWFDTVDDAAKGHDLMAIRLLGKRARLNYPDLASILMGTSPSSASSSNTTANSSNNNNSTVVTSAVVQDNSNNNIPDGLFQSKLDENTWADSIFDVVKYLAQVFVIVEKQNNNNNEQG